MPETQKKKILRYLAWRGEAGLGVTAMELINESGSTNVRARISELREEGYGIVNMTQRELRECGIKSRYKLYFLEQFAPKPIDKENAA